MSLDSAIQSIIPDGWRWCLYSEVPGLYRARAVLVSPDHRVHIGREADTAEEALRKAVRDAQTK